MVILTLSALLQYWKSILDARYQQTFIYDLAQDASSARSSWPNGRR